MSRKCSICHDTDHDRRTCPAAARKRKAEPTSTAAPTVQGDSQRSNKAAAHHVSGGASADDDGESSTTPVVFDQNNGDVEDSCKCPVCHRLYRPPIVQTCSTGSHFLCKECYDHVLGEDQRHYRCPMCREDILPNVFAKGYQQFVVAHKYPLVKCSHGCGRTLNYEEQTEHEKTCPRNMIWCPILQRMTHYRTAIMDILKKRNLAPGIHIQRDSVSTVFMFDNSRCKLFSYLQPWKNNISEMLLLSHLDSCTCTYLMRLVFDASTRLLRIQGFCYLANDDRRRECRNTTVNINFKDVANNANVAFTYKPLAMFKCLPSKEEWLEMKDNPNFPSVGIYKFPDSSQIDCALLINHHRGDPMHSPPPMATEEQSDGYDDLDSLSSQEPGDYDDPIQL